MHWFSIIRVEFERNKIVGISYAAYAPRSSNDQRPITTVEYDTILYGSERWSWTLVCFWSTSRNMIISIMRLVRQCQSNQFFQLNHLMTSWTDGWLSDMSGKIEASYTSMPHHQAMHHRAYAKLRKDSQTKHSGYITSGITQIPYRSKYL